MQRPLVQPVPMLPTSRFGVPMSVNVHRYLLRQLRLLVESEDGLATWSGQGRLDFGRLETLYGAMAAVPDPWTRLCGGQRPKLNRREMGTLAAFATHQMQKQEGATQEEPLPYPPSLPALVNRLTRVLGVV